MSDGKIQRWKGGKLGGEQWWEKQGEYVLSGWHSNPVRDRKSSTGTPWNPVIGVEDVLDRPF